MVESGSDALELAAVEKVGYIAKWDKNGKNITSDTIITLIYTPNSIESPDTYDSVFVHVIFSIISMFIMVLVVINIKNVKKVII